MKRLPLAGRAVSAVLALLLTTGVVFPAELPRPAPALTWLVLGGDQLDLTRYKGKIVALEFLLTTCPHCQKCSKLLQKMYEEYGSKGFQPLGIAINEMSHMLVGDYTKQLQLTFPVGWSTRDKAIQFLQHPVMLSLLMPQLVFIDRNGVIRHQFSGNDDFFKDEEKSMRETLESMLKTSSSKKTSSQKTPVKKTSATK